MRQSFIPFLLLGASLTMAQDVRIKTTTGISTSSVLSVTNAATSDTTTNPSRGKAAIYGISEPSYYRGIGVEGIGSEDGIFAIAGGAAYPGSGYQNTRMGVEALASGGYWNLGIYAAATASGDYAGYFVGNVMVTGWVTQLSDSSLKTNIQPMAPALKKLMRLKPKTYQMATSKFAHRGLAEGSQYGVIAQDLATEFPELVVDAPVYNGEPSDKGTTVTNYKGVNYTGLIPILIKAVQEQQDEIDTLQQQIRTLKGQ